MSDREVGNWLHGYMEYTKELESPDSYHIWIGLSVIASAVARNIWLDQGAYVLFPNMYVALVGPPARTAKTTAIRMGRRILTQVPTVKMGPDACSKEQLIRDMATSKLNNQCAITIHSSEFSSIIDTSGILMIQLLTDLYDCDYNNNRGWRYETKHQGKDEIVNPCLNMLVGTTPTYIAEAMPDNIHGHGFTSRTIFVFEEKERFENPRPGSPDPKLIVALIKDLQRIAGIHGEFKWDCDREEHDRLKKAGEPLPEKHTKCGVYAYDTFYKGLFTTIPSDHRIEGYHWRKKIHVLKVAMLLSLAERDDPILDANVIITAVKFLDSLEAKMARTFSAVGKYDHASDLERMGNQILASAPEGLPISEVFRRNYFVGDERQIRLIIASLVSMGAVRLWNKNGVDWVTPVSKGGKLPWE